MALPSKLCTLHTVLNKQVTRMSAYETNEAQWGEDLKKLAKKVLLGHCKSVFFLL
jgi:hypothetical protein